LSATDADRKPVDVNPEDGKPAEAEPREAELGAGFVLAGGRSSRMGRDKALLLFDGRPLVMHALAILREAGLRVAIAGANPANRTALSAFAPIVDDPEPGRGPLAGICAALESTSARYAVFLPVDLPLLPASLAAYLLRHARVTGFAITVARVAGFSQTFPAVVDRAALPGLRSALETRDDGCFSAFESATAGLGEALGVVDVELVAQAGQVTHALLLPPPRWFLNVNTPEDWERAEAFAGRGRRRIA
jgi:molybdenum cofactor guanylyltransferase